MLIADVNKSSVGLRGTFRQKKGVFLKISFLVLVVSVATICNHPATRAPLGDLDPEGLS